ncbi:MAG: hypothetical protein J7L66_06425 [Anaerolineaceae bacterium]|nr:hypothetical protein [Anaerolineaceae bacterium]
MPENTNTSFSDVHNLLEDGDKYDIALSAKDKHILRVLGALNDTLSRTNQLHLQFLEGQRQALHAVSAGIRLQKQPPITSAWKRPVISKAQLREFSTGSIAKCFGPDFVVLDQRKSPRIPNGDLLLIDRILSITGKRGNLKQPSSIIADFQILPGSWFTAENHYRAVPLSILMEIALQPCGVLSAYLGTSLMLAPEINTFRNLDGKINIYPSPQLSGKTITNRAELLDSFSSGGMQIQNYAFELSADGARFLAGESSFGYFTRAAMAQQSGLGSSEKAVPSPGTASHQNAHPNAFVSIPHTIGEPRNGHFNLVDHLSFSENSGNFSKGVIKGEKRLSGHEWFYKNHFFGDPVMPGSLGLEAVIQGIWAYIKYFHLDAKISSPVVEFSQESPFIWKYRGQVVPANKKIRFEFHIKTQTAGEHAFTLAGDAYFWVDGTKIYAYKNISLTAREG